MLRHAVLVIRPEHPLNHVRVVSVRPYPRVGKVGREQLVGPVRVISRLVAVGLLPLAAEQCCEGRLVRGCGRPAVIDVIAPRSLRMASEPVHEDDACWCQSPIPNSPGRRSLTCIGPARSARRRRRLIE